VTPRRIVTNAAPLQAGDVLLVSPIAYRYSSPQAGDIVLYDIPRTTLSGRTNAGNQAQVIIASAHIDRILAVGGQTIERRDGALYVDGEPTPFRPLNPNWASQLLQRTVPPGQLLIIPSTNPYIRSGNVDRVCLVSESRLAGKVLLRTQPLSRFGIIE